MARRRFQQPTPFKQGNFWYLRIWDSGLAGNRKRKRLKLAAASMPLREVQKIADEKLGPINSDLVTQTSATNFNRFVEKEYKPCAFPALSKTTQWSYSAMIRKHLAPFTPLSLREITPGVVQQFFSSMAGKVAHPTILKIRDALSSIVNYAIEKEFLFKNPMDHLRLPKDNRPRRRKPTITVEQFHQLLDRIPEPYASMLFVAVLTGLRVSELLALRWGSIDVTLNTIRVEQRFTRGDWSEPKTEASAAPISVDPQVIQRLQRLKSLTVKVRAGTGTREYRAVKLCGPEDLVFQQLRDGSKPLNDQNTLKRHIQPAARKLGVFVSWQVLRRSYATWLVQSGADPKSVQGQMRHTRISTTMDIYAQSVSVAQHQAVARLSLFVGPIGPIGPQLVQ